MERLEIQATCAIQRGKLDELKRLAARCIGVVREEDTRALEYEWFLSEDETCSVIREALRDRKVFGNPSAELRALQMGANAQIYARFRGL
jgi:hypothetical protein